MSTSSSETLDVPALRKLTVRRYGGLRLDVLPGSTVDSDQLLRGEYQGSIPLPAVVVQEGPVGDLVGSSWAHVYAVTPRFLNTLEEAGVTGWSRLPIALEGTDRGTLDLWLLGVTGRSGPIYGVGGSPRLDVDSFGQYLDSAEWDGSDMFVPSNRRVILITGRAASKLERASLRNVALEPAGIEPTP
jgi:hypothetical protein